MRWLFFCVCVAFLPIHGLTQAVLQPIHILSSDESGIVLSIETDEVHFSEKEVNGEIFYVPELADFVNTALPGQPQLPATGAVLGIPSDATCSLQIMEIRQQSIANRRIFPQPILQFKFDENGLEIVNERFYQDMTVYQRDAFFPAEWVEIADDVQLRQQRVVRLKINPIRINPVARQVVQVAYLKIKLVFSRKDKSASQPGYGAEEPAFEKVFRNLLLNYETAKKWRIEKRSKLDYFFPTIKSLSFPGKFPDSSQPYYKLFIESNGIYLLDADYLGQLGIDRNVIDPRTIKIYNKGVEQPINVTGQDDGRFDGEDIIEFYGERIKGTGEYYNPYTNLNVYWLTWGGEPGKRMPARASWSDDAGIETAFFKTIHLEQDVTYYHGDSDSDIIVTEQVSGEGWVWRYFNGGIAAANGESGDFKVTVTNLARTGQPGTIWIRFRGTTLDPAPSDHHVQVKINQQAIGDTTFNDQSECIFRKAFPADLLKEGENTIRISSLSDLGAELDQFYLDWIELDYPTALKAIDNYLAFTYPSVDKIKRFRLTDFNTDDIRVFELSTPALLTDLNIRNIASIRVKIISAGYSDGNVAQIFVNGVDQVSRGRRGYNLVVIDERSGLPIESAYFDTWLTSANADSMAAYITKLPTDRFVLCAIRDEGSARMTEAAFAALESLGSRFIRQVGKRDSWALIGQKGASAGSVPEILQRAGTGQAILNDTLQIEGAANSYTLVFRDSVYQNKAYIALTKDGFNRPVSAKRDTSAALTDISNGADYIIITHQKFLAAANRLAEFRAANNGLRTKVILTEDIYDEFNAGLIDPNAIRDFLKYTFNAWQPPAPSYVLLLGDASWDYRQTGINSQKENYVPSYGNPVSDTWFVSFDDTYGFLPNMFIGRIPVENAEQAQIALDKLIEYENSAAAQWKKNVLFITGGKGVSEQSGFISQSKYLSDYFVKPPPASCASYMIHKTTDEDLEGEKTFEIASAINSGKLWVNFLGHAGSRTWDLMFDDPDIDALENWGRLPFITSMTCHTARFANPTSSSFGEHFLLVENSGAVAFWGTSGWGYIDKDFELLKTLFPTALADTIRELGAATTLAKLNLWERYGSNPYSKSTIHQYTLLGDPLTRLALPEKPDLVLLPGDISTTPAIAIEADSSIQLKLVIRNWGLATADSVAIDIIDVSPENGRNAIAQNLKIKPIGYADSLLLPWYIGNLAGEHTLQISVDPQDKIPEIDESNNAQDFKIYIYSSTLTLSKPVDFQVITSNSTSLQVNNPVLNSDVAGTATYEFQLDTTDNFNSPLLAVSPPIPEGDVVTRWKTPDLLDKAIYFWRCRSYRDSEYGTWVQRSFSVDRAATGFTWRQHFPAQTGDCTFENTYPDDAGIKLLLNRTRIRVESAGAQDGNNARIFFNDEAALQSSRGHNIALFNPFKNEIDTTATFDTYRTTTDSDSMALFLNQVEVGWVVAIGIKDEGSIRMTEAAYLALESLGSRECRNVGYADSWAFIAVKGQPDRAKEMHKSRYSGFAIVADTVQVYERDGWFQTERVGPGNGWHELKWYSILAQESSTIAVALTGHNTLTNQWDQLLTAMESGGSEKLTAVDATVYDQVKLQAHLGDATQLSTPVLQAFDVVYEPVADLAISPRGVHFSADTVMEGESILITAGIYNVGLAPADSVAIRFSCSNSTNGRFTFGEDKILQNVQVDSIIPVIQNWNSAGNSGRNMLSIEIDPGNRIRELFDFNNEFSREVFVTGDTTPPTLAVTFDGKDIVDGDLVATQPVIIAQIKDNSPVAITDTSLVSVYLNYERIPYRNNDAVIQFIPRIVIDSTRVKATIQFTPVLADNEYILEFFVEDASKNRLYFRREFQVISEFKLLEVLNYPNPVKHTTDFTYTLTQNADWVTIKIYTIAGRLIRVLPHASNTIGFNQQFWDALDEEGDGIANGVYLYKIIARKGSKQVEAIQKLIRMR
ncbi:T9SS type A sorting domain-containing protein [candidate division KSB1 bacterium]|nr:T9SS type A sorting domain-containing protein [candidate division KSB1 bacterium]